MALRLGKKKTDEAASTTAAVAPAAGTPAVASETEDWADFGNIPNETDSGGAASDDWTTFDDLVDPAPDAATPVAAANSSVAPAPPAAPPAPRGKKATPKVALIAVPVLVVAAGAAAFVMKQSAPPVDEMPPLTDAVVGPPRPKKPTVPTGQTAPVKPGPGKAAPGKPTATKPAAPAKAVPAKPPVAAAKPVPAATPVPAPSPKPPIGTVRPAINVDQLANIQANEEPKFAPSANPGITLNPRQLTLSTPTGGGTNLSAAQVAKRTRLKLVWNDGAAAKKRGNKKEARRIWTQGLKQAEASPRLDDSAQGFRESLAKL